MGGYKLWIDAGHGGHDGGAASNGLKEKDLTLNIAKRINKKLKKYRTIKTKMTRTSDTFYSLTQRANIANNWGADAFISVHINSGGGKGFESFIYNGGVSANTRKLQSNVHANIMKHINVPDRGKKTANFAVVRQTSMPAILTENLFVDRDNAQLKKTSMLNKIAEGHVDGILKYFGIKKKQNKPVKDDDELSSKEYNQLKKKIDSLKKELGNKQAKASTSNTPDKSHEKSWNRAEDKGLLKGKPHEHLTREQFATVMMRSVYNDIGAEDYAEDALEWAQENDISDGERPAEMLTRQQGITMLKRTYDLLVDDEES